MALLTFQGVDYQQLLDDLRAIVRHEVAQAPPATTVAAADELLTITAAAELLNVCVASIHEYKRRGLLAYQKIGRRVYIKRSDVLAAGSRVQRTSKPGRNAISLK